MTGSPSPEELAEAVDRARQKLAPLDEDIRRRAEDLVDARGAFLAAGVREMVRRLKEDERSRPVLFDLVDDPLIYSVLLELGVVRADVVTRVARALERVKPYVHSHGGDVELVRVEQAEDGQVAHIRFHGSCSGCSMSAATLQEGVQEAIRTAVPEVVRVEEMKDTPVAGLVQLTVGRDGDTHGWIEGPPADDISAGTAARARMGDHDVLLLRVEDRLFAYRNACPHQGMPLHDGEIEDGALTCPWHGYCFEVDSGECRNAPQVQLEPYPLRVEGGRIWVRPGTGG
jgi:nitrite reductase/ring-hydroxylating ferredoxin subunit/Fe-S cluster biogenesis protein NfuA